MIATLYRWQYLGRQWYAGRVQSRKCPVDVRADTSKSPRRVLIVLSGLIGDSVMSTPVIIEARRHWPDAKIVLLGTQATCSLLSACPLLDECIVTPAIPFALRKRRQIAELEGWLKESNFDVAIILLGDQFAQVLAKAQIPERVGVRGHLLAPFLTKTYDIISPKDWGPQERLGALRALGYPVRNVAPQLWVSKVARWSAQRKLDELGLPLGLPFAVVHPFGRTLAQRLPPELIASLADALSREHNLRTVVIGGPETAGLLGQQSRHIVDSTGALALPELLAVIDEARIVISTDSGPFHIAGALRRPLIGLFRKRRPEHAGRYPQAQVVFGNDRQCMQKCEWDRCQKFPCRQMDAVSLSEILSEVRATLAAQVADTMSPQQHFLTIEA